MASFIKTSNYITIVFDDGESATIFASTPTFDTIVEAVKAENWTEAYDLAFPVEQVKKYIAPLGNRVKVEGGVITLEGMPIHNTLTNRMLDMHNEGFNISPMSTFLENLMDNPSYRAVNELYGFLENSNLPITEDGHFLAYKRVTSDFKDLYTKSIDNAPGDVVDMPRNQVNEDKDQTCSVGLHFCSREYLPHYYNQEDSKVIMVKINPRDVVSIPSDYNNAKGRCCRYEVVRELPMPSFQNDSGYVEHVPEEKIERPYYDTSTTAVTSNNDSEVVKFRIEQISPMSTNENMMPLVLNTFDSASAAMNATGIDSSSIIKVCNGDRQTAGGFKWRRVVVEENTFPQVGDKASTQYNFKYEDDSNYDNDYLDEVFFDEWCE